MNTKTNTNMNTGLRYLTLFAAGATLWLTTGCQTVSTSYTQDIGGPKYPPSDPAQVQVLRTVPTRPHVRLGEVRAQPSDTSVNVTKIEDALRKEAAKLGADAAVVVYDKTQVTGAMVVGTWRMRSVEPVEGRVIVAVAIKYQ
jgi:hypothetical protein